MAIQQLFLGVGAKKKTYLDDVFSTDLYKGTGYSATMTNGINLSGEGGLVWQKARTNASSSNGGHKLTDTVRGYNKQLLANDWAAQTTGTTTVTGFTSTGFTYDQDDATNNHLENYASYTFRKAKGFFDVVTWTGNYDDTGSASTQTISHSLGSIPGCIIIKQTSGSRNWTVYHRNSDATAPEDKYLTLNNTNAVGNSTAMFNSLKPTSTSFQVGAANNTNEHNETYVAYVFAGGESTTATARSVEFDGSSDYLHTASSSDLTMGTGDFTVEGWIKFKSVPTSHAGFYQISPTATGFQQTNYGQTIGVGYYGATEQWRFYGVDTVTSAAASKITVGVWYHIAHVRSSGVSKLYVDGIEVASVADTYDYDGTYLGIGSYYQASFSSNAYISNFRVVKGTAVYTSSFRPPTEPLTNITNTKVLCCNNSSTTGKTVGPTLTASGTLTASTDSPFDDPAAFTFGENENQEIIKCGSYVGNGSSTGPEINLGWEPSLIISKKVSGTGNWSMFDSMRGLVTNGGDPYLRANTNDTESNGQDNIYDLTPTGFKTKTEYGDWNTDGETYVYLCIRRPDGYVGKPPELGTDVFAMDTGAGSSSLPNFDSGFPVDFAFSRDIDTVDNWYTFARLTGKGFMYLQGNNTESDSNDWAWDSNVGWQQANWGSDKQSWMFKRHAGFDLVTYKGDGVAGHQIPHSLSKTPEMMWVKNRDSTEDWRVYHKGLNGGTTPQNYRVHLNLTNAESSTTSTWNETAPSSSHFTVGNNVDVNEDTKEHIALLFASVDGISKVGSFTNSGGTTTVSCGFQPRFVIVKCSGSSGNWYVYDTVRGINAGGEPTMNLNDDSASTTHTADDIDINSDGFTIPTSSSNIGFSDTHIFYAHA